MRLGVGSPSLGAVRLIGSCGRHETRELPWSAGHAQEDLDAGNRFCGGCGDCRAPVGHARRSQVLSERLTPRHLSADQDLLPRRLHLRLSALTGFGGFAAKTPFGAFALVVIAVGALAVALPTS